MSEHCADDRPSAGEPSDADNARMIAQVEHLLGSEGVPGAVAFPADWRTLDEGPAYLARDGHLLIRDVDLARVREVLPGAPVVDREPNVNGLTLFAYDPDVARERGLTVDTACQLLDQTLGIGVATPDHLLYLVPVGGRCPATEPEPVHTPTRPYPQPPRDPQDGAGATVWVLDGGLLDDASATHPWLVGVLGDTDDPYRPGTQEIVSYAAHGTFSAGVIRTMAPAADVFVSRTFVRVPGGASGPTIVETKAGFFESDLVEQVVRALAAGAQIISLSFGTHCRRDLPLLGIDVLETLIRAHEGVVLVAAAGNDSTSRRFWPAAFPWVVSVGALNRNWDDRAWFSNFGPWVQVFAPGEDLVNAYVTRGTVRCVEPPDVGQVRTFRGMARWSGTSFSTPLVAGLIAARMSRTGDTGREAADALRSQAKAQQIVGVGPVLLP